MAKNGDPTPSWHSPKYYHRHPERKTVAEGKFDSKSNPTERVAIYFGFLGTQPTTWPYRKAFFLLQLVAALGVSMLCFEGAAPGYAIAILGAVAAVMAFRAEEAQ